MSDEEYYKERDAEVQEILTSGDGLLKRRFQINSTTRGSIMRRQREEGGEETPPTLEEEREKKGRKTYKEGMMGGLQRVISRYIARLDRDQGDIIGPVEIKSVTNYVIIVLIALLIFYALQFILTNLQLIIKMFSVGTIRILILVLFLVSQVVFYILFVILLYIDILNYIVLFIYLGIVSAIVFVSANGLNPFSIIFTNAVVGIAYGFFILIIWLARTQLETIKRFSPNLDKSSFLWITICLFGFPEFIAANPAFLIYFFLPFCFNLLFQYVDDLVELFRGVTGPYKGLYAIEGILVMCNLLYAQYVMTFMFLYIIKLYGVMIFVFWPPWFYILPASWFTWL
jgi:hypothetical protein